MDVRKIYLWGFEDPELKAWPQDLQPVLSTDWPPDAPVVVHGRAIERFQTEALAHRSRDGRLPAAILYLPADSQPPAGAWAYFDATVQEGDWDALRRLLACPRLIEAEEAAEDLSAAFLAELARPISQLRPEELPLPAELRKHLATCSACRQAFDRAVEARVRWRRQLFCPAVEQLTAYVRGAADPRVTEHVSTCRFCQAEVSALQRQPASVWLELELRRLAEQARDRVVEATRFFGQTGAEALARLVNALQGAGLTPAGAHVRRLAVGSQHHSWSLDGLLAQLRSEGGLCLARTPRELKLSWDEAAQALCLSSLREEKQQTIEDFRIEVRKGEVVLWQGESEAGSLSIPLADLTEALEAGADQLVILAYR